MNRAEKRKFAKGYNTPQKLNILENELRKAIRKECEENADRRVRSFIQDYTTLVIYVLWYSFGFGKRRIARFADELKKLVELQREGVLSQSEFDAQKAKLLGPSSLSIEPEIISEGELSDEVRSLLDSGNMIQAMNQYIKETGASLSEAKSVLESYK